MSLEILHKSSGVARKEPTPSMMTAGELALNYNAAGPFLTCRDSAGKVRRLPGIFCGNSPPLDPSEGEVWLDTRPPGEVFVFGLDGWQQLFIGSTGSGGYVAPVIISDTAPTNVVHGDLWWSSKNGNLFVYYTDTTSGQWVITNATSGGDDIIDDGVYF